MLKTRHFKEQSFNFKCLQWHSCYLMTNRTVIFIVVTLDTVAAITQLPPTKSKFRRFRKPIMMQLSDPFQIDAHYPAKSADILSITHLRGHNAES